MLSALVLTVQTNTNIRHNGITHRIYYSPLLFLRHFAVHDGLHPTPHLCWGAVVSV
jgi:hypothetical protein